MTDPKDTSQTHFIFSVADFIFGRSEKPFTGTLGGAAYFIFPGVSPETLRAPGTKLTLSCQDDTGKVYEVSAVVTAKSTLLKSFSTIPPRPSPPARIEPQREIVVTKIDVDPYVPWQPVEAKINLRHINNSTTKSYRVCFQMQVRPHGMEEQSWSVFAESLKARSAPCTDYFDIPFQNDLAVTAGSQFSPHAIRGLSDGTKLLYLAGVVFDKSGNAQTPYCATKGPSAQPITYCKHHN